MGVHRGVRQGERRVPLREAAQLLGVSKDALRQRIRRGTIRSEKGEDGRVYVYVDASTDAVQGAPLKAPPPVGESAPGEMVDELRDRLRYVETQLQAEREAHAESRRLLLAALEKIPPAIEPPSEQARERRESPEMADDEQQGRGPVPAAGGPREEGAERRSWWREFFGFD